MPFASLLFLKLMANGSEIECVQYILPGLIDINLEDKKKEIQLCKKEVTMTNIVFRWMEKKTIKWETKNNHKRFSSTMYEHTMKHVTLEIRLCDSVENEKRVFFLLSLISLCSCRSCNRHFDPNQISAFNVVLKITECVLENNSKPFVIYSLVARALWHHNKALFLICIPYYSGRILQWEKITIVAWRNKQKTFPMESERKNHSHLHSDMEIGIKHSEANCFSCSVKLLHVIFLSLREFFFSL